MTIMSFARHRKKSIRRVAQPLKPAKAGASSVLVVQCERPGQPPVASENPHVRVWRLLSKERRHQSGYASDFYLSPNCE